MVIVHASEFDGVRCASGLPVAETATEFGIACISPLAERRTIGLRNRREASGAYGWTDDDKCLFRFASNHSRASILV
jgi:hypothetical protein